MLAQRPHYDWVVSSTEFHGIDSQVSMHVIKALVVIIFLSTSDITYSSVLFMPRQICRHNFVFNKGNQVEYLIISITNLNILGVVPTTTVLLIRFLRSA